MRMMTIVLCALIGSGVNAKEKVACIGDSITFGSSIQDRETNSYPAQLQNLLGSRFEVKNFGNPGRGIIKTSKRGSGQRAFLFMKEHRAALEFDPDIVICNLGINDVMDFPKEGNNEAFVTDYVELINTYRENNKKVRVILWAPLAPLHKGQKFYGDSTVEEIHKAITDVVDELNAEAKKNRWPKVATIDMNRPLRGKPEMFPDFIHPNADGAEIIAEETYRKLKKLKLAK